MYSGAGRAIGGALGGHWSAAVCRLLGLLAQLEARPEMLGHLVVLRGFHVPAVCVCVCGHPPIGAPLETT